MQRILSFLTLMLLTTSAISAASAKIDKIWIEHDVTSNGKKAIRVHLKLNIIGQKDKATRVCYWVESPKGTVHKVDDTSNGDYGTSHFVSKATPRYENSSWEDYKYVIYLDELKLKPGKHTYYVFATVNNSDGDCLKRSEYVSFTGTGSSSNSQRQANNSNSNSNRGSNGRTVARQWRVDNPMGGYTDYVTYSDGSGTAHTVQQCYFCHGSKICSVCYGRGGTYNSYTQIYYPCGSCLQKGTCKYCNGTGTQEFFTSTDAAGNAWGTSNGGTTPTYRPAGGGGSSSSSGSSSSGSSRSGSRSSSSSRYGTYDCPTCYGTTTCQTCHGSGYTSGYTAGSYTCPNCYGNYTHNARDWGKCSVCKGTGKKYGVK